MSRLGSHYHQTLVCSGEGDFTREAKKLGVNVICISSLVREISPGKDVSSFIELYKLIKKNQFDIIHTHSSKTGFIGRIAGKFAGVKTIVHTVHGFAFPATKNKLIKSVYYLMELLAAFCTSHLIVMNSADLDLARKYLPIRNNRIHLLNNAVDSSQYRREGHADIVRQLKDLMGIDPGNLNIVMVGRLSEQKNPLLLLTAFNKIADDRARLYFIGDGPLRGEMEEYIQHHQLSERVHLVGWQLQVNLLLPQFELFVLPSRWEGMPLAILEAMAASVPVICSDIAPNKFLIEATSGLLFKSDDVDDLARQIKTLLQDKSLRKHHAEQALVKVKKDFDLNERIRKLEKIYVS
ncbi:glycosyltransferase family 4 protein [Pseudomonas graminis]